jgi:hypothetical protein
MIPVVGRRYGVARHANLGTRARGEDSVYNIVLEGAWTMIETSEHLRPSFDKDNPVTDEERTLIEREDVVYWFSLNWAQAQFG